MISSRRIALYSLSTRIPIDDVSIGIKHVDRIVGDALHEKPETAFGIFQLYHALGEFFSAFFGPLFKALIQLLKRRLRLPSRCDLALVRLIETSVVDSDRGLCSQSGNDPFRALGKDLWLGMAEKETAQNFAGSGNDRNRKVTPNGQDDLSACRGKAHFSHSWDR